MMKRGIYLYILMTTLLFVSCEIVGGDDDDSTSSRVESEICEQTTVMYFMGTDLKSRFFDVYNIPDAKSAVANGALGENGRLIIFLPSYTGAELYELYESGGVCYTETIKSFDSNESLDEARIAEVIAAVKSFAPANTYNIIFSGHGTGWVLKDWTDLRVVSSVGGYSVVSSQISFEKEVDSPTRYMGCKTDGYMDVEELRSALDATYTKYGYLLFDMCLMSNIETLYELKGVCDNVVASPCEVMGYGFPYQTVLPELFADDGATANLSGACEAYYNSYKDRASYPSDYPCAAVAHCVTSELDDLADVVLRINEAGVNDVDIDDLQCYEKLKNNIFCDLGHYISEACTDSDLYIEFEEVMSRAFPEDARFHTDYFYTGFSGYSGTVTINSDYYWGVSTSDPSEVLRTDWAQTSWAVATTAQE